MLDAPGARSRDGQRAGTSGKPRADEAQRLTCAVEVERRDLAARRVTLPRALLVPGDRRAGVGGWHGAREERAGRGDRPVRARALDLPASRGVLDLDLAGEHRVGQRQLEHDRQDLVATLAPPEARDRHPAALTGREPVVVVASLRGLPVGRRVRAHDRSA